MKHVYPPRHPAWLDDKARQAPSPGDGTPQGVAPREQGDVEHGNATGSRQPAQGSPTDVDDGAAGSPRRP